MWNWDGVFEYLAHMCDEHESYYQLSIEEGARFKDGPVGRGWGVYNLRQNILPQYRRRYPNYEFGVSSDRKYLWCRHGSLTVDSKARTIPPPERRGKTSGREVIQQRVTEVIRSVVGNQCTVKPRHSFPWLTYEYKHLRCSGMLERIHNVLTLHREHQNFVRGRGSLGCDIFLSKTYNCIVEVDEEQHFTIPRRIALDNYPTDILLGFDRESYTELCRIHRRNDPDPPYRDEQRAFYDTLRDIVPLEFGLNPTVRVHVYEFIDHYRVGSRRELEDILSSSPIQELTDPMRRILKNRIPLL